MLHDCPEVSLKIMLFIVKTRSKSWFYAVSISPCGTLQLRIQFLIINRLLSSLNLSLSPVVTQVSPPALFLSQGVCLQQTACDMNRFVQESASLSNCV